jgi:ABC-type transport system involved in multi-copper enzyme maturation permease subunit
MNWNRIMTLATFDLRHTIFRLKGLVFLIPFLFFWYRMLEFLYEKGGDVLVSRESVILLSWLYKPAVAQILLIAHPASLSVFLIMALATTPFFTMLGSSDQTGGDAARQTFRFFLTRCTRTEIFLGRMISAYSLVAIATVLVATVAAWISWHNDQRPADVTIMYAAQVALMTLLYILSYVAYMSAISALMSSALSTLLMGTVIYLFLAMIGSYLSARFAMDITLVPGGMKELLFGIHPHDQLYAGVGLLAYSAIFGAIGWFIFHRRNL